MLATQAAGINCGIIPALMVMLVCRTAMKIAMAQIAQIADYFLAALEAVKVQDQGWQSRVPPEASLLMAGGCLPTVSFSQPSAVCLHRPGVSSFFQGHSQN